MGERRYSSAFDLALDAGEWSASRSGRFAPSERVAGTHSTGGWVGPRASLDAVEYRTTSSPCREWNPGRPARRYTDWAIPALL
jgi:hypothetical protein